MENSEDKNSEDGDIVKNTCNTTILDIHIKESIPKWAIKTNRISESKLHLLSISSENVRDMNLSSSQSECQLSEPKNETNKTPSSTSLSMENVMHQRKIEREDIVAESGNVSPQLSHFLDEVSSVASDETVHPPIPESIFGDNDDEDDNGKHSKKELSIKMALTLLLLIFSLCLGSLLFVYSSFPKMNESESKALKFPSNIEDAKILGRGKPCRNTNYISDRIINTSFNISENYLNIKIHISF